MKTVPLSADRWAPARAALRTADPRMADLIAADPTLVPTSCSTAGRPTCGTRSSSTSSSNSCRWLRRERSWDGSRACRTGGCRRRQSCSQPTAARCDGSAFPARKPRTSRDLAERFFDGPPDLDRLQNLDDEAARTELMVKGLGRFTADGVLMFALRRPDIWPAANLALRRAVERVWDLSAPASIADIDAIGERFRPWRTLAALYLYRSGRREAQSVLIPLRTRAGTIACAGLS